MNPGETRQEYIEWNENIFKNKSHDAGDVTFIVKNIFSLFHFVLQE